MKVVISIFCLPYEIDDLENTLNQLKKSSYYLDSNTEWVIDVTMGLSDELIDWKRSSIPKEYFETKLIKLSSNTDWCEKIFRTSTNISGCVSQRRNSLLEYPDADYFIWLDTDIIFDERTLFYIDSSVRGVSNDFKYSVITPEVVKLWDNTWDCLVNEKFKDKDKDYQKTNDPYLDSGIKGDIKLEEVVNNTPNQPKLKFAGGWFTCLSKDLLDLIGIPESFGHYGFEDTFIMWGAEHLIRERGLDVRQFKITNLVVCENYKYRTFAHYLNHISVFDKRDEYRSIAMSNFQKELDNI